MASQGPSLCPDPRTHGCVPDVVVGLCGFNFPRPLSWPVSWGAGTYLPCRVALPGSSATWLVLGAQQVLRNAGGGFTTEPDWSGTCQGRSEIPTFAPDSILDGSGTTLLTDRSVRPAGPGVGGGLGRLSVRVRPDPDFSPRGSCCLGAGGTAFSDGAVGCTDGV